MKEIFVVTITGLTNQGEGVGRLPDGRAVFVPFVVPGDEIEITLQQSKKSFARGRLQTILTTGEGRKQPRCRHFQQCGGCSWQHLHEDTQQHWKTQIVQDALQRVGRLQELPEVVYRPAQHSYGLRTRARLHVDRYGNPGYYQKQSRNLLEIHECPVLTPSLEDLLQDLRRHLPQLGFPIGDCRVLCNERGETVISLHTKAGKNLRQHDEKRWQQWCQELQQDNSSLQGAQYWSGMVCLAEWGQSWLKTEGSALRYTASDFAQASFAMNRTLIRDVLALARTTGETELLELYAGRGNFSLPLAEEGFQVHCLEYSREAVTEGKRAAEELGLSRQLHWQRWNDEKDSLSNYKRTNLVLLDPPRRGLDSAVVDSLLHQKPQWLLYVSCDPVTLARDAKRLCEEEYNLEALHLVDLMPQTPHVETIALFKRTS